MKNSPLYRRLLSVVLAFAMVIAVLTPTSLAKAAGGVNTRRELELTPIDPETVNSRRTGRNAQKIEKEPYGLLDVVRVSIVLEKASTMDAGFRLDGIADNAAAKSYREGLRADQAEMTARIEKAIGGKLDVKWNITLAANIISANVLYGQISSIEALSGVKEVRGKRRGAA